MRALQYNCFSCEFTTNDSHFMYFFGYPSIHYQFIFIFGVLVVSLANSKQIEWSITRTCTVWPLISASNILTNLESKIKSNQGTYEYPGISLMDGSCNASYLAQLCSWISCTAECRHVHNILEEYFRVGYSEGLQKDEENRKEQSSKATHYWVKHVTKLHNFYFSFISWSMHLNTDLIDGV